MVDDINTLAARVLAEQPRDGDEHLSFNALLVQAKRLALAVAPADPARQFYIVWNGSRNEGFVTEDANDARSVLSGEPHMGEGYPSMSVIGEAFYHAYDGDPVTVEEITITVDSVWPTGGDDGQPA